MCQPSEKKKNMKKKNGLLGKQKNKGISYERMDEMTKKNNIQLRKRRRNTGID